MSEKFRMAAAFITNLDGGFAKNGREVYNNPLDKLIFQKIIKDRAVLVGRKTYDSLPPSVKSLPACWFILSRSKEAARWCPLFNPITGKSFPQFIHISQINELDLYMKCELIAKKGLICIGGASVLNQLFTEDRIEFAYITMCNWHNDDSVELSLDPLVMDHVMMNMQCITSIDGGGHTKYSVTERTIVPETRVYKTRVYKDRVLSFEQLININDDKETKEALVRKYRII